MQRYIIDKNKINENLNMVSIDGNDFHHIKNVMRMHVGDKVILCTNDNVNYLAIIDSILSSEVILKIIEKTINVNELNSQIYVAQGLTRREKCEEVLRRLVELGASCYFNVAMERSVVKMGENKKDNFLTRRMQIVKEATEQCERGQLMTVLDTQTFKEFITYSEQFDYKILCYEESGRQNSSDLKKLAPLFKDKKVIILVGPEGGISPKELNVCLSHGFIAVGLGKRILRTETAPLFIMSAIVYELEIGE